MLKKISLVIVIIAVSFLNIFSKEITGIVIDNNTKHPIPYANITINGQSYGTISNEKGIFKINVPNEYINKSVIISFVGYEYSEVKISDVKSSFIIKLRPVSIKIDEIVIMPDSTIYTFLKKAYDNISNNYPSKPTLLKGFYRESISKHTGEFLYIAEAVTNNYKTSYRNRQKGQTEIIKSRKNISQDVDSTLGYVRFYGGVFIPHFSDIIHEREDYIKPKYFKNFNYVYMGTTMFSGNPVYIIECTPKKQNIERHVKRLMYIDVETLAYVYFETEITGDWHNDLRNIRYTKTLKRVMYCKDENNQWFLKSIIRNSKCYNAKLNKRFTSIGEYVTIENQKEEVNPIEYDKQISYSSVFSNIATNYNESFWKDYNVLEKDTVSILKMAIPTSKSNQFISRDIKQKKNTVEKALLFFNKLNVEIGLSYSECLFPVDNTLLYFNNNLIRNNKITQTQHVFSMSYTYGYKINKRLSLNFKGNQSFSKKNLYNRNLFFGEYTWCLKSGGKQLFLLSSIGYGFGVTGYHIGDIDFTKDQTIRDHELKKGTSLIYSGNKYQAIVAGLTFKTKISKMYSIIVGGDYSLQVRKSNYLIFKESKGFIKTKTFIPINELEYYENNLNVSSSKFELSKWNINLGLVFDF